MAPQNSADQNDTRRQKQKKDLDAFLEKSTKRREEMDAKFAEKKDQRKQDAALRHERAQTAELEEVRKREAQREAMKKWREDEKKRKDEVARMLKDKQEAKEREEKRIAEKKEEEKQKKDYMKTLSWSASMQRLKKSRKKLARESKEDAILEAEHEYKQDVQNINLDAKEKEHQAEIAARQDRGDEWVDLKFAFKEIEEDIGKRKAQLFAKEQTEMRNLTLEFDRKRGTLKSIRDASLQRRTRDEISRNEKLATRRLRAKYTKLKTDLEVERTQRRDEAKKGAKKEIEKITSDEQDEKTEIRQTARHEVLQSQSKMQERKQEAKELENSILAATFQEVAAMKEEQEKEEE